MYYEWGRFARPLFTMWPREIVRKGLVVFPTLPKKLPENMPIQMRREAYLIAQEAGLEPPEGSLERELKPVIHGDKGEGPYRLRTFGERYDI